MNACIHNVQHLGKSFLFLIYFVWFPLLCAGAARRELSRKKGLHEEGVCMCVCAKGWESGPAKYKYLNLLDSNYN